MNNRQLSILALAVAGLAGAATAQPVAEPLQTQQQVQQHERIYGYELMTPEERQAHREAMRHAKTREERDRIRAEHHQRMQQRAKERGITLPDEPPMRGLGGGMGPRPDAGMGPGKGPGGGRGAAQ